GGLAGAGGKAHAVHGGDAEESLGDAAQFEHGCYLCSKLQRPCQVASYIGYTRCMAADPKLSHTAALILQAIQTGDGYGFSVMEMTGLPSGTVYPAVRRLERDGLIRSQWEGQSI